MRSARRVATVVWVAVTMLLVLAVFFALVGGAQSAVFLVVVAVIAVVFGVHQLSRHRHRDEIALTPEARSSRERRGF